MQEITAEPLAEHGLFLLIDQASQAPWLRDPRPEEIVRSIDCGIGFRSDARDFYPLVRIRIHDDPPPPVSGKWDAVLTSQLTVPTGHVSLRSIMGDIAAEIELTPGSWAARCHVRGRVEALLRWQSGELFFHGGEEWIVQLWPVTRRENGF
jgi:hypothetical protein